MSQAANSASAGDLAGLLPLVAFQEWIRDRCEGLAAAMAYNAILAISSFFMAILLLCARIFGRDWVVQNLVPTIRAWVGPRGEAVIRNMMVQVEQTEPEALFTLNVLGAIGLIYGASALFLQMQDSLETVWNVRREVARPTVQIRKRLLGLLYAAVSALIVQAAFLGLSWLIPFAGRAAGPPSELLRLTGQVILVFGTFWALITFWLKFLLPVRLPLRQILPWSALIAVLHLLGRWVFFWLAGRPGAGAEVEIGEAIIAATLWFHFASMVFLYGAQLMKVHLVRTGKVQLARSQDKKGTQIG